MNVKCYATIILVLLFHSGYAQVVEGRITDPETKQPLTAASVTNITRERVAMTDAHGHYTIAAGQGDSLTFFSPGYKMMGKRVPGIYGMSAKMDISLIQEEQRLQEVVVNGAKAYNYRTDSAEQATIYKKALGQTHANPIGSPFSALAEAFSKRAKEVYKFQKDFKETEAEKFVDGRYSPPIVRTVTGMKDTDSIAVFIRTYPMARDFADKATDLEVKMWIRNNYKQWMKRESIPGSHANQ